MIYRQFLIRFKTPDIGCAPSLFRSAGQELSSFTYSHHQPEGQFHADHWAEYAILSLENNQPGLEFRRVPFDAQELIRIYRESGRPFAEEAIEQY